MTEKKKKWPDNTSSEVGDWDFDRLTRYMVVRAVESFIMGGSKALQGEMHWLICAAIDWDKARRKRDGE